MVRLEDWPKRYSDYLTHAKTLDFEWGKNDCILFAARGLEAITGVNLYEEYLGYTSKEEAEEIVEKNGGVEALISKHLGQGTRNFLTARRGDLVMLKLPEKTLGIVDDSGQKIACVCPKGITKFPLEKAWRVWTY